MTIAIVKDGQFLHTLASTEVVTVDGVNHRLDEPKADLVAAGIYEFVPAVDTSGAIAAQDEFTDLQGVVHPAIAAVPKTRKAQGTVFAVDGAAGIVTESFLYVDLTHAEIDAIANTKVLADIAAIEAMITNRRIREASLTTEGRDWLAAADASISTLRATLIAIPAT